ncbi:MAG: hypothetical protein ACRDNZ_00355 [Streptosporangiaceae bacterium]
MTPDTTAGGGADSDRVALRLGPDLRRRLRLLSALEGRSVQAVLAGMISAQLPSAAELVARVRDGGPADERG